MAGEEKGAQVPGASAGADPGTGDQEVSPEVTPELVSSMQKELAGLKASQERLATENRALQSAKDTEAALERKRGEENVAALQAHVRAQMEEAGATSDELASFTTGFQQVADGQTDKQKAAQYDELQRTQGVETQVRDFQDRHIKTVSRIAGVEIPPNHPDIKRSMDDSPDDFENSVEAVAKKLAEAKAKGVDQAALDAAAEAGALDSLGGGAGGGTVNPISKINKPEDLYAEWEKRGRPIAGPSD